MGSSRLIDLGSKSKKRNYVSILYPESAPEDWLARLSDLHIPAFVSPMHEPDEECKKPHYHILLMFKSPVVGRTAQKAFDDIGAIRGQYVEVLQAYARYLAHLDDPDKQQFPPDNAYGVQAFGGADYMDAIRQGGSEKFRLIGEILRFADDNQIYNFASLVRYCNQERVDWLECVIERAYFIKTYLRDLEYEERNNVNDCEE